LLPVFVFNFQPSGIVTNVFVHAQSSAKSANEGGTLLSGAAWCDESES